LYFEKVADTLSCAKSEIMIAGRTKMIYV